jgi:Pro-kumamolisin, activation domain
MPAPMRQTAGSRPRLVAALPATVFAVWAIGLAFSLSAHGQTAGPPRPLITQPIVETSLVRLFGNVRPEANTTNDRGRVPDSLLMEHMFLQLQRRPAQEQALKQLIDELHDPRSPNFHRWLTPSQFGAQFGPAPADIERITTWLLGHGFTVNVVYPSGMGRPISPT